MILNVDSCFQDQNMMGDAEKFEFFIVKKQAWTTGEEGFEWRIFLGLWISFAQTFTKLKVYMDGLTLRAPW